ncbi:MCE family protein [Mycolicibacterium stellerae]|uniref:MCE family protein n=1 Tax=Mycolicibacterium stellerae TaxID=2358193 RepID=UPI000F0BD299|nr:MCE family protein [Mycolicibacterium stellerae]
MTRSRALRIGLVAALVLVITCAAAALVHLSRVAHRVHVVAYFENSNGVFAGDDVRIRGVNVGKIETIEAQPDKVKISFWFDTRHPVPADAKVVILSPTLITARAIQLTPPYQGGPTMATGTVIGTDRTAVPMEWDDFRTQLQKLAETLQPTEPEGVSTLGSLINTTADNLRGQGAEIRNSLIKLSQAVSAVADHSDDTFTSVKNLATLVSALRDSTDLLRQLNVNFAEVTHLLNNNQGEVANAVKDLDGAFIEMRTFIAENRETVGTTADKLTSVSQALNDSIDDIKQSLHLGPTTLSNAANLYQPAQGALTGIPVINNFSDPITFLCGGIQAASRLNSEQSAKLCVQYLAPIVKNRQYNFPPIGMNPFVGATTRPNEITYSEDRLRPDFVPPQPHANGPQAPAEALPPLPAEAPTDPAPAPVATPTDPNNGLLGLMAPPQAEGQP